MNEYNLDSLIWLIAQQAVNDYIEEQQTTEEAA